jgi:hypothetical protein
MSDQAFVPASAFEVADESALFEAVRWAAGLDRAIKVRVVETEVGPYGAIDQQGTTTWFDIGDVLVFVLDHVIKVPKALLEETAVELEDESE